MTFLRQFGVRLVGTGVTREPTEPSMTICSNVSELVDLLIFFQDDPSFALMKHEPLISQPKSNFVGGLV